ncbi:MAG: HepT-like ribonuclease domain-containing protein [Actinomycetota bacterium]
MLDPLSPPATFRIFRTFCQTAVGAVADVPWDDIRDIRILVDHVYHRVDYDILWRTLTHDVPHLRAKLKEFHETS